MMIPGTIKDQPQAVFTKIPAISEPKMLPTEVWEFQIPIIKPRLKQSHSKTNWSVRKQSQSVQLISEKTVTQSVQLISQETSHSQFSWLVRKQSHSQFSWSVSQSSDVGVQPNKLCNELYLLSFPIPVPHTGDYRRPATALNQPSDDL